VIFAPDDTPFLYPYPEDARTRHLGHVDIDRPDVTRYPLYRQATSIEFSLAPGQLLFLPAFWWHHVTSLSVSISGNQWWQPALTRCTGPNGLRTLCSGSAMTDGPRYGSSSLNCWRPCRC
jgi:hypothetical protein